MAELQSLEEKMKELKLKHEFDIREHKFKQEIEAKVPTIEKLIYMREDRGVEKKIANFETKSTEEFKELFLLFPPTNNKTVIGSACDEKTIESPFRMDINNPATLNRQRHELKIDYESDGIEVRISVPIKAIDDFVKIGERKPTDSESIYFCGMSHSEIGKVRIRTYLFKEGETIGWYGGNRTLLSIPEINKIIDFLLI